MKNFITKTTVVLSIITFSFAGTAQVGIGVASPNAKSILDLTNSNNKGLLLPKLSASPTATSGPEGMLFYYSNNLYLRDNTGFNAITPWKYKYNTSTSNTMSYTFPGSTGGVGIGVAYGSVKAFLHIADSSEVAKSGTKGSLLIGDNDTGKHMLFDNDEIMVKSTQTTGGILKLQDEDGSLVIGSDRVETVDTLKSYLNTSIGSTTNKKNLTVNGNIDAAAGKVKEYGNDLLPRGAIIMWSGKTPPAGWALCDGKTYLKTDGSGSTLTPNLMGRFIVAYDTTATGTAYNQPGNISGGGSTPGNTGGQYSVSLSAVNLPQHQHTGTTNNDGAHSHTDNENARADNDDNDGVGNYIGGRGGSWNNDGGGGNIRPGGSNHTHNFTTSATGCVGCTATAHENRPPYYTLAFIIKL